eukprot:gene51467-62935_t
MLLGWPVAFEQPELRGFNFAGGLRVIPELVALVLALSIYTAGFIAEIVRAGIVAVSRGQSEAAHSLGLRSGPTLRLVIIPQAMRVIVPPLTSQYLNLTKNSTLGVAIGYPDLFAIFAGTTLNQTGQAIEIIAITMAVYLGISLLTSALMGLYNKRVALIERYVAPADLLPQQTPPLSTSGPYAWARAHLFGSIGQVLLTLLGIWLVYMVVPPMVRFFLLDAVWTGTGRDACLPEVIGRPVGACWPFIGAKMNQIIYGFYPEAERWRVNIVYLMGVVLL